MPYQELIMERKDGKKFPILLVCSPSSFLKEDIWKNFDLLQKTQKQKFAKNYEKCDEDLEKLRVPIPKIQIVNNEIVMPNEISYGDDFMYMNLVDINEIYNEDVTELFLK